MKTNVRTIMKTIVRNSGENSGENQVNRIYLTFQLFGADVIFTNNLHPYLLEFNKGPSMKYMNNRDEFIDNSIKNSNNKGLVRH